MNSSRYPLGIRQEVMCLNCSSGGLGQTAGKAFYGEEKNPQGQIAWEGFGISATEGL